MAVLPLWVNEPWTELVALAIVSGVEKVVPDVVSVPENGICIVAPAVGPMGVMVWPGTNFSAVKGMHSLPQVGRGRASRSGGAERRAVPGTGKHVRQPSARLV